MTLDEILNLKESFEDSNGSVAMEVHLTKDQASDLRLELLLFYGFDNGEMLTTLFGMEVVDINAKELRICS
ncbi:MAG: hypothetical protein HQL70_00280 [Magnetococcales bacterium]|nr:hypothetical protein [Magnetococcales bacterium]